MSENKKPSPPLSAGVETGGVCVPVSLRDIASSVGLSADVETGCLGVGSAPKESRNNPNPDWVTPKEGEVVGAFMRRGADGGWEMGDYVVVGGEVTERLRRR